MNEKQLVEWLALKYKLLCRLDQIYAGKAFGDYLLGQKSMVLELFEEVRKSKARKTRKRIGGDKRNDYKRVEEILGGEN